MESNVRAHVIVSGKVQGVFFRAKTQQEAFRLGVRGWVRNRPEGTVEAIFEGDSQIVEKAIEWCWKGSPMARVANVEVQMQDYSGEFGDFSVRY
jgi:acylphosphatase